MNDEFQKIEDAFTALEEVLEPFSSQNDIDDIFVTIKQMHSYFLDTLDYLGSYDWNEQEIE